MKSRHRLLKILIVIFITAAVLNFILNAAENKTKKSTGKNDIKIQKKYSANSKWGKYRIEDNKGYFRSTSGNFEMTIEYSAVDQIYKIEMKGKTTGWIAAGFGRTDEMKDAEIIMGYVEMGKPYISHHYAQGKYSHTPLTQLEQKPVGKTVELISGNEENNVTTVKFSRPVNLTGEYYKKFQPGMEIEFMYALGKSDDIKKKHSERGVLKIMLP